MIRLRSTPAASARGFATAALLAVLLFALGAAAHFAHHLLDTHCDEDRSAPHPCACSVLHGAALAADEIHVTPAAALHPSELRRHESDPAAAFVRGRYAPRAPPRG